MSDNTDGFVIAASCLSIALTGVLNRKGLLSQNDTAEIADSAELFFASLPPSLMSETARDYARQFLQDAMKVFPPKFDSQP